MYYAPQRRPNVFFRRTTDGLEATARVRIDRRDALNRVSSTSEVFIVAGKSGHEQRVRTQHGQLPPAPETFTINKPRLTLRIYRTKNDKDLYPHHFQITK